MNLEDLQKRVDDNAEKITYNLEKIIKNSEKIIKNEEKIHKNSLALDILKDYKKQNKRLFAVIIIELIIWLATLILFHM